MSLYRFTFSMSMLQSKNRFNFEIIGINKINKLFINFELFYKIWIQNN